MVTVCHLAVSFSDRLTHCGQLWWQSDTWRSAKLTVWHIAINYGDSPTHGGQLRWQSDTWRSVTLTVWHIAVSYGDWHMEFIDGDSVTHGAPLWWPSDTLRSFMVTVWHRMFVTVSMFYVIHRLGFITNPSSWCHCLLSGQLLTVFTRCITLCVTLSYDVKKRLISCTFCTYIHFI
jgi:hypothetical protein